MEMFRLPIYYLERSSGRKKRGGGQWRDHFLEGMSVIYLLSANLRSFNIQNNLTSIKRSSETELRVKQEQMRAHGWLLKENMMAMVLDLHVFIKDTKWKGLNGLLTCQTIRATKTTCPCLPANPVFSFSSFKLTLF